MGNLKLAFFLAYKSIIKGNRWTLVLVILVVALSFANMVLVPSLLSGITIAINQQQINTLYGNIVIDPQPKDLYLRNLSRIESQADQISGIDGLAPHLSSSAFFEYQWQQKLSPKDKGKSGSWDIIGVDPQKEPSVTTIQDSFIAGSYLDPADRDKIVLGVEIAGGDLADNESFLTLGGAPIAGKVRLTYANGIQREYTIKGIFKARQISANSLAYVTYDEMASVLGPTAVNDSASQILLRTKPGSDNNQILSELRGLGINGQIRSWKDYGGTLGGIVSSFNAIASLIGAIGLIVAAVVMFIVIYINALNRRRQIGILRAIGINRSVVMISYLLQALVYAALGIILGGIIFGYVLKLYFDVHPIDLPVGLVNLTITSSVLRNAIIGLLISAVLAGIIPTITITRESIIKAIWGI